MWIHTTANPISTVYSKWSTGRWREVLLYPSVTIRKLSNNSLKYFPARNLPKKYNQTNIWGKMGNNECGKAHWSPELKEKQPHIFLTLNTAQCKGHSKAHKVLNCQVASAFPQLQGKSKADLLPSFKPLAIKKLFPWGSMKIPPHMHVNDESHWGIFF